VCWQCSGAGHVKKECPSKRKFPPAEVIKILQELTNTQPTRFAPVRAGWQGQSSGQQPGMASAEARRRFMARRVGRNRPQGQRRTGGGNHTFSAEISDAGDVYDSETGDCLGNLSELEPTVEELVPPPQANLLTAADAPESQPQYAMDGIDQQPSRRGKGKYDAPMVWSAETMMNMAQVEQEEWSADSPTGECNVLWPGNVGSGQGGEQALYEQHATQEAGYHKTPVIVQAQREQHWVEDDDEEPTQPQESARTDKDKELAYATVKAGVGSSATVRLMRLLTLGSPAMVILICLVARAKAVAPISDGASLLLQQDGWNSQAGVAQVPVLRHARFEMKPLSSAKLKRQCAPFLYECGLLYSGNNFGGKVAGYISPSALTGVQVPQIPLSPLYRAKLPGGEPQSKVEENVAQGQDCMTYTQMSRMGQAEIAIQSLSLTYDVASYTSVVLDISAAGGAPMLSPSTKKA